jgi:hypothetical protein
MIVLLFQRLRFSFGDFMHGVRYVICRSGECGMRGMLVRLCYGDFDGSYADWGGLMG